LSVYLSENKALAQLLFPEDVSLLKENHRKFNNKAWFQSQKHSFTDLLISLSSELVPSSGERLVDNADNYIP
jgi:hypothetical protein